MSTVFAALAKLYPGWLQSCDSYILYFVPDHRRYRDARDSLYVTSVWVFFFCLLIIIAVLAIALLVNRIAKIVTNHL